MKKTVLTLIALSAASAAFASDIPARLQQVAGLQEIHETKLTDRNPKQDDSLKVRYTGSQDQSQADSSYQRIGRYEARL
ncbi:hypothetical protein V9W64_05500 [Neisseria leonii]|uniref:Uncharacterized protein n=1 Tax=Neisseria leonii TaxID=2995413 RepID=A0A9X4IB80_9NEIS|nr:MULTISPECIES: hypothetical protein [unclassified Neisseria]MDD9326005.1 hypothetical protein [Neisseria sp. 3986]MDD9328150.1 hypothetical protein [Neisseria sp. 51.81]